MNTALIKPQWSPLTVALMVFGFIIFAPLGFAVLAYILWGEYFGGSKERAENWINTQKANFKAKSGHRSGHCGSRAYRGTTGNAAFDDYRAEQLDRLEAERKRLDEERAAFEEYMANLHKARDREEFDRFMRERTSDHNRDTGGEQTQY